MSRTDSIISGRHHADLDGDVVVFPIGMKINRLWAIHRWLRPTVNTARMWWHLQRNRPAGYLGGYLFVYARGVGMMQYWRDFDALEGFSRDDSQPHLAAWRQLVRQTAGDQTFGYWHETYVVNQRNAETIYGSMSPFGLSEAVGATPITAASETARGRLAEGSR
ncbi:MAG: DUF4188 domain-containing protein [Actinomycetota bacterium]